MWVFFYTTDIYLIDCSYGGCLIKLSDLAGVRSEAKKPICSKISKKQTGGLGYVDPARRSAKKNIYFFYIWFEIILISSANLCIQVPGSFTICLFRQANQLNQGSRMTSQNKPYSKMLRFTTLVIIII